MAKSALSLLAFTALLVALGYVYLRPASNGLLAGDRSRMMSDGTDMTSLPFEYWMVEDTLRTHPTRLLYGGVYTDQLDPPGGVALWVTWVERFAVVLLKGIVPLETMPAAIGWFLLVLNGAAFFWMGKRLGWHWAVCVALGIAWAFNPFTRARASVHLGMAGTYVLPLLAVGLTCLADARSRGAQAIAALCFLGALSGHIYFSICIVALSPFWLFWTWIMQAEGARAPVRPSLGQFVAVSVPAMFLLWCFANPLPPDKRDAMSEPPPAAVEMFMNTFAARPLDYFSSDVKFGASDWNPLREKVNRWVLTHLDGGNAHERAVGIRWVIWLFFFWAIWNLFRPSWAFGSRGERRLVILMLVMALTTFWLSLNPNSLEWGGIRWSPFLLINQLLPQFRVPARFGIFTQFAVTLVAGICINRLLSLFLEKPSRRKAIEWAAAVVLIAAVVVDYPPAYGIPMDLTTPHLSAAETGSGDCGTGLIFPYLSGFSMELVIYYRAVQVLRETRCKIINLTNNDDRNMALLESFGPGHPTDAAMGARLAGFARCSGLDWIYFRQQIKDPRWRKEVCDRLGWKMVSDHVCRSENPSDRFRWDVSCFKAARLGS